MPTLISNQLDPEPPDEVRFKKKRLNQTILLTRMRLIQMHYESGVGHIGGNLSCLDLMMTLFHETMNPEDEFVLSKGHAAGALYATLWSAGKLNEGDLKRFHKDGGKMSGHPAPNHLAEIPFATGSLGHGLSLACGLALGKRLQNLPGRVFCLLSDGEWQEGSNWEALIFLIHHQLPVTLLIDTNGLQGFGSTEEVASQQALTEKFKQFGLATVEIDGHDTGRILIESSVRGEFPRCVVARTIKGKGVSFMENRLDWHYLPLKEEQYQRAMAELKAQKFELAVAA